MIRALIADGRFDEARDSVREEAAQAADQAGLSLALAEFANWLGDYEFAVELFDKVASSRRSVIRVYTGKADSYFGLGKIESAIACLRRAIELDDADARIWVQLGVLQMARSENEAARRSFERALANDPDAVIALNNLAFLMASSQSDLDRALTLAERARSLAPNSAGVADTLGLVYLEKGLSAQATSIFRDLVSRAPSRARYHYLFARALAESGIPKEAEDALQLALESSPTDEELAAIKELRGRIGL